MRRALLLGMFALSACAAMPERDASRTAAELDKALDGRVAGKPEQCVSLSHLDGPQIVGDTLIYRDGGRLWRAEVVGGCPGLNRDPIIVNDVYGSQLCRNDRFRTIERTGGIPGPYCRFGNFTPYTRPKS
jgi:hypothetical protein